MGMRIIDLVSAYSKVWEQSMMRIPVSTLCFKGFVYLSPVLFGGKQSLSRREKWVRG